MLYMIVEDFRGGDAVPVYRRFRDRGRLAPEGLRYVASWVTDDLRRCFQVMECDGEATLREWIAAWDDIVDFQVVPFITSAEAAAAIAPVMQWNCVDGSMDDTRTPVCRHVIIQRPSSVVSVSARGPAADAGSARRRVSRAGASPSSECRSPSPAVVGLATHGCRASFPRPRLLSAHLRCVDLRQSGSRCV